MGIVDRFALCDFPKKSDAEQFAKVFAGHFGASPVVESVAGLYRVYGLNAWRSRVKAHGSVFASGWKHCWDGTHHFRAVQSPIDLGARFR